MDTLQDFFVSSCAPYEPPNVYTERAIQLDVTPPPAHLELSHELAFGFAFADEMKVVRQIEAKCDQGRELFMRLYFARSCASAIPPSPPTATDATDVAKLLRYFGGVYEVLQPQVAKLRMLCDYCTQSVGLLSDTIQRIAAQENTHRVIPDVLLDGILDMMDIVLQMNQLHDRKSSLRNDFSMFKRAFKHVQGDVSDPEIVAKEIQRLQEFVGSTAQSKNAIWDSLRHNLTSVKRYAQVVFLLVKQCLGHLDSSRCLLPNERFKFIRVLPCLMAVLNADPVHGNSNGFQSGDRKLIDATGKLIGRFPIVPIFADLSVKPMTPILELNLEGKADQSPSSERNWDSAYDLVSTVTRARKDCVDYMPRLMFALNKIQKVSAKQGPDKLLATSVASLSAEGIRYLSDWKSSLLLFLSLKYQRPKSDYQLEQMGVSLDSPYLEYQRVITHNFEGEELRAVADIVHLIKTVAHVLQQHAARIAVYIRSSVYIKVQQFVQHSLVTILHRADKKKHASAKSLQEIRLMCGDWIRNETPVEDYKKRRRERQLPELKSRLVSPSRCQIQMLRSVVNAIYAKRTGGDWEAKANIFSFHRELKSSDIDKLNIFYLQSADFEMLLELEETLGDLSAFPEFLFRELFLEVTRSPQMPVDDSLPWLILTRGAIDRSKDFDSATALSLMDVYNDAASCLLRRCEQVSVCNEIFAEANLFFDHLVYALADFVYTAAKSDAARAYIGSDCIATLHELSGHSQPATMSAISANIRNFRAISSARQVAFLDDHFDLMGMVSGHLNVRLSRDLRSTVSRMARADITIFVAAADLLELLRRVHAQLAKYFLLDDFQPMWLESLTRSHGKFELDHGGLTHKGERRRLRRMVSAALTQDLVTKFGFNERTQRFFRTPLPLELRSYNAKTRVADVGSVETTRHAAAATSKKLLDGVGLDRDCRVGFELMHQPFRSFVGTPHFEALNTLLSHAELVEIVDDCLGLVTSQLAEVMYLFLPVLGAAIPPYRLPRLLYRAEGCYGYFEGKFRHVMDSKELEAHVFHCLRVVGNTLLAVHYIETVNKNQYHRTSRTEEAPDLFVHSIQRLHNFLVETDLVQHWGAESTTNPEQVDKNTSAFFLVWNAIEYLSCCSQRNTSLSCYREIYGEGIYFAGCALVHLLGQRSLYDLWNPSQYVLDAHSHDETKTSTMAAMQHNSRGRNNPTMNTAQAGAAQTVGTLDPEMVANAQHFVLQATQMRQTCQHFFAVLEDSWSSPTPDHADPRTEFVAPS